MYGNGLINDAQCKVAVAEQIQQKLTVGESLETRIAMLKAELKRLEDSRETLAPLLGMKIRDIRDAMNY